MFFLPKDHYFMFLASLVQDYYPDTFLIMMLNVDVGLKAAVILQVFWNSISKAEAESEGIFLMLLTL